MDDSISTKAEWIQAALQQYEGRLIRYASQITGDPERARDVVQETFIRLCAEDRNRIEGFLAQWLFTVCRNRALDVQRKEHRMVSLDESELTIVESCELTPSAAAEQQECTNEVLRLLATLPPNQQEVVRLKFQSGLNYQEISAVTKLTVSNVGFLLHTALKTIRQRLKANLKSNPVFKGDL